MCLSLFWGFWLGAQLRPIDPTEIQHLSAEQWSPLTILHLNECLVDTQVPKSGELGSHSQIFF